ncbi:hypothetical protein ACJIZ3_006391 [Penstemon smallii]|uniref:Secreted protein n=1 Tax=Penstemon smallii TaxID=265156 RepID=A0ABD3S7R2_9LAMI
MITKCFLLLFSFTGRIAIPPDSPSSGNGSGLAAARLPLGSLNLKISRPFNRALSYKGCDSRAGNRERHKSFFPWRPSIDGKMPFEAFASVRHRPGGGVHFLRRAIRRRLASVMDLNIQVRVKAVISEYVVIILIPCAKHAAIVLNFDVGTTDVYPVEIL